MPRVSLRSDHTGSGQLLPDREHLLSRLPRGGTVAEVGVADGDFSRKILDLSSPKTLHLIDAWSVDRYRGGIDRVSERLEQEIADGRVEIHQGMSTEVLPTFSAAFFDWVYIDTNHSYETTAQELEICDRVVQSNGRIAGHDFCVGNIVKPVVYGVVQAVNEFCVERDWQYEYVTLESDGVFSFCLRRL
jgi:hypothetical protein